MDEESLFKNGWERIIEIGRLGKSSKFFGDLGSLRRKPEKIRKYAEPVIDLQL
jgi:hypothetical protein